MNDNHKIIRDSIHGDIKFEGVFLDLLDTPELQRLYNIKQLGLAHLVFPGAHHTRLEHSLGAYYMASRSADMLNLQKDEREIVTIAALLHDIGHGPFSHTLEALLRDSLDVDHVVLTEKLIFGEYEIFDTQEEGFIGSNNVHDILEKYDVDEKKVSNAIKGESKGKPFLSQLIDSAIDVDQLDYLMRDAYYTGVAYGMIDIERFLQTLSIHNNNLVVKRKGVGVVENILMARALMYSSIYFHKTVRIAELMLSKAIELIPNVEPFDFFKMTDCELINDLKNKGEFQQEISTCLKYRNLFKQAYVADHSSLNEQQKEIVKKLDNSMVRREKEEKFEDALKIKPGHVIIDVPYKELIQSEPRINQTNIMILEENKLKPLDEFTPIAKAIRSRHIPDWMIMIITDEKHRTVVAEKAEKILFN